ncbi:MULTISPECIES: hypothetical protein [Comamonadaceae]|uniref:hypothetical protein n=1 Tax=Comamonadaceae TaxID=80864 RepID=UPI00056DCC7B|nr:hypothetical protein [Xenophilus azovorans]MBI2749036.1 hypothetical protein [Burkholderiales bacterium]
MSPTPSIAVVLEGGLVQAFIVQNWPAHLALPRVAIVDHDTEGADREELTRFHIGNDVVEAFCRGEDPLVYTDQADVLSPGAVLSAIGQPIDDEDADDPPVVKLRELRKYIVDADELLIKSDQSPTGEDYEQLYQLVHDSLVEVLKAMGDPTDFGG